MRHDRCWSSADAEVWCIDVSQPLPNQFTTQLSDGELARAGRIATERDRARYLSAHHALRCVLASAIGVRAERIAFGHGRHGKPFLVGYPGWHFSFSRRGDVALVGLSNRCEIGVDVEPFVNVRDVEALAEFVCSPSELAEWAQWPASDRAAAFATCWTRKEATLKAAGVGLSVDPATIEVGFAAELRHVQLPASAGAEMVHVESFAVNTASAGAVAIVV